MTPQRKKDLSYEKDCRNCYGQNDKASRRLIPLRKAKAKRAYRKQANQIISASAIAPDLLADNGPENRVCDVPKKRWQKVPDAPLKESIQNKFVKRVERFGRKKERQSPAVIQL